MYITSSVHLELPVQAVSAVLMQEPQKWFPGLSAKNFSAVGIHLAGVPLRKSVAVEFGVPVKTPTWAVVPITWKATYLRKVFPVMNGKIELAPVSKDETRLTVSGMYAPPLGSFGAQLDEAVMHRVAEATVKDLADAIAKTLKNSVGA